MFFWSLFSCIQSEYRKIRIIKNSLFGHFSHCGRRYQQTNNFAKNEAVTHRCSVKKGALRDFANSQENNCARVSFLIKLQAGPAILLKKRLQQRCFSVKNTFFTEHLRWLVLFGKKTQQKLVLSQNKTHNKNIVSEEFSGFAVLMRICQQLHLLSIQDTFQISESHLNGFR